MGLTGILVLLARLPILFVLAVYFYILEILAFFTTKKKDVRNEIVLITGAGHGIGREVALEFGRLGARVVIWDINQRTNEATAQEIKRNGGTAHSFVCDLTKTDEIRATADRVRREIGNPYILVNNAGILTGGELLKLKEAHIRRTFEINTLAHFWTCQEFMPAMMSENRGHIVTIASMSAKSGTAFLVDYSSSKYAAYGFAEALNEELRILGKTGIHTTTVCPMFVDTGLVKTPKDRVGRILTPKEVAMATVEGVLTNDEIVYVPRLMKFQMALSAFFPREMVKYTKKLSGTGIEPQYDPSTYKTD
ncbi:estradiol 17-beta-dehydrogenase 11-like [Crassostrea virginica]|uniref:Short-chain dehydrogenase/reductase 3 n=1 Tax=Crassostrea virginica TaxID=6565 RepID=A0A8B8A6A8_CRAVI|nr:estradiol 17-beta-dehydrogenase 11-like [Crassostrea virginica]